MTNKFISSATFLTGIIMSGAAFAGGYTIPVVTPAPVVVAPVVASDWAGGYVGGALGYTFSSDDVVGTERYNAAGNLTSRATDLGQVDVKGVNLDLHAGYRWQKENWVFGPELNIEGGSVDSSDRLTNNGVDTGVDVESSVNYVASLRFKAGYAVNPETLIYGTLGIAYGDFDYEASYAGGSQTRGYTDTGLSVGLGAERKLNEKLSVFAEWEFREFGKTTLTYDEPGTTNTITTQATPEHHNIKIGVNYRF